MKQLISFIITILLWSPAWSQSVKKVKKEAVAFLDAISPELNLTSYKIWSFAEPSYEEYQSSGLLIEEFQKNGFQVETPFDSLETMFVATYGNKGPVIGLFGEYDADHHASNHLVPYRSPIDSNTYGHGAGHNLLGVGALGTALALKKLVADGKISCRIKYFGTTDETGYGGKTILAASGYFDDLDISLYWHPSPVTVASTNSAWDAMAELDLIICGQSIEMMDAVNKDKPNSRTAAKAVLDFIEGRQNDDPQNVIINYSIASNNHDLKLLPDTIKLGLRIQHASQIGMVKTLEELTDLCHKVERETQSTIKLKVTSAHHEFIVNQTAMRAIYDNMVDLEEISYTPEEVKYSNDLQAHVGSKLRAPSAKLFDFSEYTNEQLYGYSSDIGDASWFAPEVYFVTTCLPRGAPMHEWTGTVFSGHTIGQKGMVLAAKTMTLFVIDYLFDENLQKNIREEFLIRTEGYTYKVLTGKLK